MKNKYRSVRVNVTKHDVTFATKGVLTSKKPSIPLMLSSFREDLQYFGIPLLYRDGLFLYKKQH